MENLFFNALSFLGADKAQIDTLLFGTLEDDCHGTIMLKMVIIIANFLLGGIVLAGTIGIIVSGIQIITARDNAGQLTKAKQRLIDIVIGLVAFSFMYVILNFVIPGGVTLDSEALSSSETCPEVADLPPAPLDPVGGDPTTPGTPTTPGAPSANGCSGNTVERDGYCWVKTQIMAYDYVKDACKKYHTCQSHKSSEWGSSCAMISNMNAGEMITGKRTVHESITSTGAKFSSITIDAPEGEDNVSMLLCNGSLSRPTTKPGARAINRIAMKRAVKYIIERLESGHLLGIAVGAKNRGTWSSNYNTNFSRHFVTLAAYPKEINSSNVDSVQIEFESGNCLNGGKGHPEPYDQPVITLNGKEIKFQYVDPWGATLGTTSTSGKRIWRLHYNTNGWYFYQYNN